MTIFTVIRQQILMPLRAFLRILWVAHLMSDLGTESTFIARTENSGVVHSIQATARCLVRALDALLGFGIDNTERNGVEVRTHAVHAEPDQSNFLPAPVEGSIGVTLRLPFAVLYTRHIIQHVRSREGREPYTVFELMTDTNNLMLVHVKAVIGIVVARDKFFETQGLCKLVHATLGTVKLNPRKSLFHNRRALTTGEASNGLTAALVKRDLPARAEVLQIRVDLRTYGHGRRPDSALDCAALLDRENTTAMDVTGRSVFSGLHEDYLVRISFDTEGDITVTFPAVSAIERDTLETLLDRIAGIIMLAQTAKGALIRGHIYGNE